MADLELGFDSRKAPGGAQPWLNTKATLKKEAVDLEHSIDKVGDSFKRTAKEQKSAAQKADEYVRQQRLVAQIMRDTGASHATAAKAVRLFRGDLDKAEKEAGQYARAMDRAQSEVRQLAAAQRMASGTSFGQTMTSLSAGIGRLQAGIALLAGAGGLGLLARSLFGTGMQFEQLKAQLDTILGPQAEAAFNFLREFAVKTPFELENLTAAYIRLQAVGIAPTEEMMTSFGDIAAGMGKDITDFAEAVVGAATGEMERLKQFGIVARQQGDQVKFIFRGTETTVKKSADAIVNHLEGLGKLHFAGGMQKQMSTLGGAISNLKDAWSELMNTVFEGGSGALATESVKALTSILTSVKNLIKGVEGLKGPWLAATAVMADAMADVERIWGVVVVAMLSRLATLAEAIEKLGGTLVQSPVVQLAAAFDKQLAVAVKVAEKAIGAAAKAAKEYRLEADKAGKESRELADKLENIAKRRTKEAIEAVKNALKGVGDAAATSTDNVNDLNEALDKYRAMQEALRQTAAIAEDLGTSTKLAAEAQKLLASGAAKTAEEALALAKETELLKVKLDQLAKASPVKLRITADVEAIDQDVPDFARQELKPVRLIKQMREVAVEETQNIVDATSDMLSQLADAAARFDSNWAEMLDSIGRLINALGQLGNLGGGASGGGGQGSAANSAAQAMSAVSTVIAVFTAIYDIYSQLQSDRKGKRFGDTVAIGGNATSGTFRYGGEETFSSTQGVDALGPQAFRALRASIDEWRIAMGSVLTFLPELNISIQQNGEKVRLMIAGQVIGFFASAGEAAQAGIEIALQNATFEGMGDAMRTALDNIQRIGAEAFLDLIPVLREIDDAAAGLTATQSAAKLAADQWAVSLDVMTEKLIDLGMTGEQVIDFRNREIAKMVEQTRAAGLNLAGINLGIDALAQWQAGVDAVNGAAQRAAASSQAYADAADAVTDTVGGGAVGGGDGGGSGAVGGMARVEGGLIATSDRARELAEVLDNLVLGPGGFPPATKAVEDLGGAVQELPDQVGGAAAQIEQWFRDTVSAIAGLTATSGAFQQILEFQERYGVELVGNEVLRRQIAEMEFIASKLRIQLLAMELIANAELLGLTAAQLKMIEAVADAIADIEFPGVPTGGAGSGGRGASRRTAADNFRAEVERMEVALSGATDGAIAYAQASDRLREQHRQGKLAAEELTYALSLLAEIQLGEIADDWRTASERLGQTDVEAAASELRRRASVALADALAAAADNPAAYEAAREAIEQGLTDQMRRIGFDALGALGSPLLALQRAGRDTIREIEYLVDHLEELGLTAGQVASVVRQSVLPSLFEMAAAEAERVGDLERAARLRARQAEIERALMIVQVRLWEAQLIAAGAMTDAIQTIIDNLLVDLATVADDAAASIDWLRAALAGLAGLKDPGKAPGTEPDPFVPIWMTKPPPAPDTRGSGARDSEDEAVQEAGETLADIIEELRRNAEGPMERLASAHEDMMERIAAATGTAAERLEAIALAEEEYARLRQEILEDAWTGVKALIEDQMSTGILGGSPEERRRQLTREVYALAAQAAAGDLDAAKRLGERGGELLGLIEDLYGGSDAGAGLAAPIVELLQQAMAQAGLAGPLAGLGQNIIPPGPGPGAGAGGAAIHQAQTVADLAAVVTTLRDEFAASRAQSSALTQAHIRADTLNTDMTLSALYALAPDARDVAPGGRRV